MDVAYFLNIVVAPNRELLIHRQDCIFPSPVFTQEAMLGKHSSASSALAKAREDYPHYEIRRCEHCCNE